MLITITKKLLTDWIETLKDVGCPSVGEGVMGCDGNWKTPTPMLTCAKCQVIHEMIQERDKKCTL